MADDQIPDTLMPIVRIIFDEYMPLMDLTVKQIRSLINDDGLQPGDELPRSTERFVFKMGEGQFKRASFTYSVWRMQRLQKIISAFSEEEKKRLAAWLLEQGQYNFLDLDFGPSLKRQGLTAALA